MDVNARPAAITRSRAGSLALPSAMRPVHPLEFQVQPVPHQQLQMLFRLMIEVWGDNTLWIITEADRSVTTVLLADEY